MEGLIPLTGVVRPTLRKYPQELRERAARHVNESIAKDPKKSMNAAVQRIRPRAGVVPDTLRVWPGWRQH
jgi:transposase-like protein